LVALRRALRCLSVGTVGCGENTEATGMGVGSGEGRRVGFCEGRGVGLKLGVWEGRFVGRKVQCSTSVIRKLSKVTVTFLARKRDPHEGVVHAN